MNCPETLAARGFVTLVDQLNVAIENLAEQRSVEAMIHLNGVWSLAAAALRNSPHPNTDNRSVA